MGKNRRRRNSIYSSLSKVTAPQDAHRRLVLQVYLGSWLGHFRVQLCYLATRPEVEGFRDQDFALQIYLNLSSLITPQGMNERLHILTIIVSQTK